MAIQPLIHPTAAAPHHVLDCTPDDAALVLEQLPAKDVEREQPGAMRTTRR